jgi:phosphatidate cytidylyltransferase
MSIEAALSNPVFLTYLAIVGGILALAGGVLGALTFAGKDVSSIWRIYRGWLIMIPLIFGALFLGRVATIAGVTLLAIYGFKEFARATGLYEDWWYTAILMR